MVAINWCLLVDFKGLQQLKLASQTLVTYSENSDEASTPWKGQPSSIGYRKTYSLANHLCPASYSAPLPCARLCLLVSLFLVLKAPFSHNVEPMSKDFGKVENCWSQQNMAGLFIPPKASVPMQCPYYFPSGPSVWLQRMMLIQKVMLSCYSFHFILIIQNWGKSHLFSMVWEAVILTTFTRAQREQ